MLMLAGGWASAESTDAEKNYDKAVKEMEKGYAEMGKVVNKLDADKDKAAVRHFNKALKDFDNAVVYLGKAEFPADEQPAVDSISKGLAALEKAVKEYEKNDLDKAQQYYDEAQGDFAQASYILD
jgi:hypothetical protein